MDLAVGYFSSKVRKNPIEPNPNVAMVNVVLIHASVVRSSASAVRNFANVVRSGGTATFSWDSREPDSGMSSLRLPLDGCSPGNGGYQAKCGDASQNVGAELVCNF